MKLAVWRARSFCAAVDQQNAEDDCCNTRTHTLKMPPILDVLVNTYLELLEVGLIRSVLLMRTEQTLNKKEFVQELTEVVKRCMYDCFQLPCFTEFRLKPPAPSIIMVYAILSVNSCFPFYTSISIPCFAFIYVVLIMRIYFFFFFFHFTRGFVICVNVLLLVNKFMKTDKIVLLSQFELKFYKDQKCHPSVVTLGSHG